MHATAIIVAAGEGRRIGGDVAKTYLPIAGRPLILRTLDRIFSAASVSDVVLVVAEKELARCEALLRADGALCDRSWVLQSGGATRQQSAKRGLAKIGSQTDIVIIHDGARPFISPETIERCVALAGEKGAVVVGVPARDTIKIVSADLRVENTPDRNTLWEIQTPQAFRRELIVAAHDWAARQSLEVTDDAMVVEKMGAPVFVVQGDRLNFKITLPEDLWLAELLIDAGRVS